MPPMDLPMVPPPPPPRSPVVSWLHNAFLYFWNFRYLPMRYRWPMIKLRRRLLPTSTGLHLRFTFRAAGDMDQLRVDNRLLFLLRLLWPWPRWYYAATLPPSPRTIMAAPNAVRAQVQDLWRLRLMPLWCMRDTPQRSLYRIYEAICASDSHMTTYEVEYFWKGEDYCRHGSPRWATAALYDPRDDERAAGVPHDPERFAILAAITEVLVDSFMWRLELGLRRDGIRLEDGGRELSAVREHCPAWTADAPRLDKELVFYPNLEVNPNDPFHRRNIMTSAGFFYTV